MARESSQDGSRPHAYRILFWLLLSSSVELPHWVQIRVASYVCCRGCPVSVNRIHPLRCGRAGPLGPQGRADQVMVCGPIIPHALFATLYAANHFELLVCAGVNC